MKSFLEEYQDLENRVEESFTYQREQFGSIKFLTADDETEDDYEDCPTTYYNHPRSGEEKHGYVTKIDSDGIHIVDSDDYSTVECLGLKDLNGLYYAIELLEDINKQLNKTK